MKKEIKKLKVYYEGGNVPIFGEGDTEVRDKINEIIDIIKELKRND
jgi:hypothetical protein